MAIEGRRELPRPPRRPPDGSGHQTTIEQRAATAGGSRRGRRKAVRRGGGGVRPPRAWYLVPLVLAVLAAGAGTGWLLRQRDSVLDPDRVLDELGPSVVMVHASTCGGSGRGTGVVIGPNKVLTATSVIRGPVTVAIETADGAVRRADVEGVDASGVAVLVVPGAPLGLPVAQLADATPVGGDVAVLGFTVTGTPTVTLHGAGPAAGGDLTTLADAVDPESAGAPVADRDRRVAGLVTEPAGTTRTVGLSALRELAAGTRPLDVERAPSTCTESKGPQAPVAPRLAGQTGKLADESAATLGEYLTAINRHDPAGIYAMFTGRLARVVIQDRLRAQYRTAYLFSPTVLSVRADGSGADVRMTHNIVQWTDGLPDGMRCARFDIRYDLVRVDGRLRVEYTSSGEGGALAYRPCDGT